MAASQAIAPSERIRELSAINAEVAGMLQSAGHAINSLTRRPLPAQPTANDNDVDMNDTSDKTSIDEHKEAFSRHTEAYYTALQSIVARLRRQAYALEEAGIIEPEAMSATANAGSIPKAPGSAAPSNGPRGQSGAASQQAVERGTHNSLDVGWLNSRGNRVGREKDAELVEEAKSLLENVLDRSGTEVNGG